MKIAVLIIATSNYIKYTYPLVKSIRKYFLTNHQVDIFIFTDSDKVPEGTTRIFQEHRPFPYPTLMRYHIYLNNKIFYKDYDYVYHCDADMLFVDTVEEEIFGDVVAVCHPGFYLRRFNNYEFEKNPISTAYVIIGEHYYCGGMQGGRNYLKICELLKLMIDIDLSKNFIATWHDESYFNKLMSLYPPDVVLDPSYCYPDQQELIEKWKLKDIKPRLIAITKEKK
jgi:histo-blood group ABO system transferase